MTTQKTAEEQKIIKEEILEEIVSRYRIEDLANERPVIKWRGYEIPRTQILEYKAMVDEYSKLYHPALGVLSLPFQVAGMATVLGVAAVGAASVVALSPVIAGVIAGTYLAEKTSGPAGFVAGVSTTSAIYYGLYAVVNALFPEITPQALSLAAAGTFISVPVLIGLLKEDIIPDKITDAYQGIVTASKSIVRPLYESRMEQAKVHLLETMKLVD
ncbi:MAG: hypothetical protein V1859_06445 [archaeon]